MKRLLAFFLSLTLLLPLAAAGCSVSGGDELVYQLSGEPVTLDPQVAADANARVVVEALFEGLTRLDETGAPVPGVAERWEANSSCTAYTFYLRTDARWSDETPVTAADFVYAFQRALDPSTGSSTCQPLFCIKNARAIQQGQLDTSALGVTAQNDHTLLIELEYSSADFPALAATTPFMPCNQTYFESTGGKYGTDSQHILSNGPFSMENIYSWEHGSYINLVRSPTYVGETAAASSRLTLTIASSSGENALTLLSDGTTDAAALTAAQAASAEAETYTLASFCDTTWGLCFNTQSQAMADAAVRRLFLQSLDRQALLSFLPTGAAAADAIVPPSAVLNGSSYRDAAATGFYLEADPDAAAAADAKQAPAVTVLCPDDDNAVRMANQMITSWNASLGHYYNMEPLPEEELAQRVQSGDYDIALTALRAQAEGPLALLSLFCSGSAVNPAFLQDADYDALLEIPAGSSAATVLERCQQAERYLSDNAIFYPIYFENRYYAAAKGVSGIVFHPYELGVDFIHAKKQ